MKVALSTHGRFHSFDLARELHRHGVFDEIWTSYPAFKVANEGLPPDTVHSVAFTTYLQRIMDRVPGVPLRAFQEVSWIGGERLDKTVRRQMGRDVDVLVALSGGGLSSGRAIKARGGVYVCDRGSTHIRYQEALLREEYARYGVPFTPFFPRMVDKELQEYDEADAVLVATKFGAQTYIDQGIPEQKMVRALYGVNLDQFYPTASPPTDSFEVVFAGALSIRKGIRYLVEGFDRLKHPKKRLTLLGQPLPETEEVIAKAVATGSVVVAGSVSRDEVRERMSRSHVLVLPSVEDGMGMVQTQAMACRCPVIATRNTGCEEIFEDGKQGFAIDMRDAETLADRLTQLADSPDLRERMAAASLERVKELGGWNQYGDAVFGHLERLLAAKGKS